MVRSGRRTLRPRSRSPEKAWGEVTSWTRWRSMKRRVGAFSRAWTTWESQSFSMMVRGIILNSKTQAGGPRYGAGRRPALRGFADGFAYLFGGRGFAVGALIADGGRGQHSDGAGEDCSLVGEDISEHVLGKYDVEALGTEDQLHGAVIDQDMIELDVGVIFRHFDHYTPP